MRLARLAAIHKALEQAEKPVSVHANGIFGLETDLGLRVGMSLASVDSVDKPPSGFAPMSKPKKPAQPFLRQRGNTPGRWYFRYQGHDIPLGPDKDAAWAEYHRIVSEGAVSGVHVADLVSQFLDWHKHVKGSKPGTVRFYQDATSRYVEMFGKRVAASVTVADLDRLFKGWEIGPTMRGNVVRALRAVHAYGMERHGLQKNPAKTLPKPKAKARKAEYSAEFWAKVMVALDTPKGKPFADLLTLLWRTGARPKELREARPDQYSKANRWLLIEAAEAKGGEDERVIRLDDECIAILDPYLEAYRDTPGPILRNNRGKAWTSSAVNSWAYRLKAKGLKLTVYGIRHTWARKAIRAGVNLIYVARMLGHKDLTMLNEVYADFSRRDPLLGDALTQING